MGATHLTTATPVDRLLRPRTVAVIGDLGTEETPARRLLANLLTGSFGGAVLPVSPDSAAVGGILAYPSVEALPLAPDLALLTLPEPALGAALEALAARGAGAAVVVTDAEVAAPPIRAIGGGSAGVVSTAASLNASLWPALPARGSLALVCQDPGFAAALLDHAAAEGIGLSHVVTLGRNDDLGFTAVLDWLSRDGATRAILIEVSRIKDRRGFLSAARAAARGRAVVALRTADDPAGDPAAEVAVPASLVFAAALRRVGVVDVPGLEAMLEAATTLGRPRRMEGERVFIVSSSAGLGALAARAAEAEGAALPQPGPEAAVALGLVGIEPRNPLIAPAGSGPNRVGELVAAVRGAGGLADAVIAVHAPLAQREAEAAAAEAIAAAHAAAAPMPVIAALPGGDVAESARARLAAAGLPAFATIEAAARAAGTLIRERRTRAAARELPSRTVLAVAPDRETVRRLLARVRRSGRATLTEDEAEAVLNAYGIPTAPARVAADAESAAEAARALGFPVVLKARSADLPHKTAVGGVTLDLETTAAVRAAAEAMEARLARLAPEARREGFLVQRQIVRAGRQELFVMLTRDPLFGPAIAFGQGGTAAGIAADIAADLPPLNRALAAALVGRTRVARLLAGFRDRPPADREAIYETLVRISQLAVDFPDIAAVDVNPLVSGPGGVIALDAWIEIDPEPATGTRHLAIAPYPAELVRRITLRDGRAVTLRPIRPEDADAHAAFFARLSPEDVRLRFFAPIRALSPEQIARMTQIDYDREMAIIATTGDGAEAETLGVVRLFRTGAEAEFAIVVRSDMKGSGLGGALMRAGLDWAREAGIARVTGDVLAENEGMLAFVRRLGFSVTRSRDDPELMVAAIDPAAAPAGKARAG